MASQKQLTPDIVKSFNIARVFKDHKRPVNSLDIEPRGEYMVSSGDDDQINIYNTIEGTHHKLVLSKTYGCSLIRFAPSERGASAICASNSEWEESIRYLSLQKNQYHRYFKGHRAKVVSLAMSPLDDIFLSASLDFTMRMWDLRVALCQGKLQLRDKAALAWSPDGTVFAVCTSEPGLVRMYDARNATGGTFGSIDLYAKYPGENWRDITFSPDGTHIAVTSEDGHVAVVDAFSMQVAHSFEARGDQGELIPCHESSFSPDSKFVTAGAENGSLFTWQCGSGAKKDNSPLVVRPGHVGAVQALRWHPDMMMIASACTNICLWQPDGV